MELHDESAQKIKSYNNAIFNLERYDFQLHDKSKEELLKINGVGNSLADTIESISASGTFPLLDDLVEKTPPGVMELLDIKGLGVKKIKTAWAELGIDSIESFLEATQKEELINLKGFGAKTIENIREALEFFLDSKGKVLLSAGQEIASWLVSFLEENTKGKEVAITGEVRRNAEEISMVSVLLGGADVMEEVLLLAGKQPELVIDDAHCGPRAIRGVFAGLVAFEILFCHPDEFGCRLFHTTGAKGHFSALAKGGVNTRILFGSSGISENEIYAGMKMEFIPPELREGQFELDQARNGGFRDLLTMDQLKGSLHNHSNYSDGKNTLREMAEACRDLGYEYLGMADHSKTAFYASGLYEEQVEKQHLEIDQLNEELAPFRIFKGIESDILTDGSLDYANEVLDSFDFVVASVHSVLNMDKKKATERLLKAIQNPYTTILGHMTGRLLLQRKGYPVDHKLIIDQCAAHNVVIEINAHPIRLDLDWRWVHYALEKGVMLSINPDAHKTAGFHDMKYGVDVGRKGGLTPVMTLNAMSLEEIDRFFKTRKSKALNL